LDLAQTGRLRQDAVSQFRARKSEEACFLIGIKEQNGRETGKCRNRKPRAPALEALVPVVGDANKFGDLPATKPRYESTAVGRQPDALR
jgi:hypothetical protein